MSGWQERLDGLELQPVDDGALRLYHARGFHARRRGLAGVDLLPPEVGLRIHRCNAVHTLGMRFGLDLIWLGTEDRILRLDRLVEPRRQRFCVSAKSVVEVAAGSADLWAAALGGR